MKILHLLTTKATFNMPNYSKIFVKKRDGREEEVHFDKITSRIKKLCYGLNDFVDPALITMKVINGLYPGVTTQVDCPTVLEIFF